MFPDGLPVRETGRVPDRRRCIHVRAFTSEPNVMGTASPDRREAHDEAGSHWGPLGISVVPTVASPHEEPVGDRPDVVRARTPHVPEASLRTARGLVPIAAVPMPECAGRADGPDVV